MNIIQFFIVKQVKGEETFDGTVNFYDDLCFIWDENEITRIAKTSRAGLVIKPFDYIDAFLKLPIVDFNLDNNMYETMIKTHFESDSPNVQIRNALAICKSQKHHVDIFFRQITFEINDIKVQMTSKGFSTISKEVLYPFAIKCNEIFVDHYANVGDATV